MREALPVRLGRAPIATAIFEFRFESRQRGLADLLPGMLYNQLSGLFPTINNLPISEMPLPIRQSMPDWQFQTVKQLASANGLLNLNIANQAINIQVLKDYPGWPTFQQPISKALMALDALHVIGPVTRYSLRYQNILDQHALPSSKDLKVGLRLGSNVPLEQGLNVRGEFDHEGVRAVVQVATGVNFDITVFGAQTKLFGTLVDVDTMDLNPPSDFFTRHTELLTNLHDKGKRIFFDLLTDDVINRLEPVWQE